MPLRQPKVGFTVSYRRPSGKTANMVVLGRQEAAPPTPDIDTSASGGTLAAGTYTYRITAVIDGFETAPSEAASQVTTGSTSTVTVDWTTIAATSPYNRATAFNVYGRTDPEELLDTVDPGIATSYEDTGADTPDGAPPEDNDGVRLKDIHGKQLLSDVPLATAMTDTEVYFSR